MTTLNISSVGVSPAFAVSAEELELWLTQSVMKVSTLGVQPPTLGAGGGPSVAHLLRNAWFPWIDEKIVEPKWDGVAVLTGTISNRPTMIKDFHMITLMRAVDYLLQPRYMGKIIASVGGVIPTAAPLAAN